MENNWSPRKPRTISQTSTLFLLCGYSLQDTIRHKLCRTEESKSASTGSKYERDIKHDIKTINRKKRFRAETKQSPASLIDTAFIYFRNLLWSLQMSSSYLYILQRQWNLGCKQYFWFCKMYGPLEIVLCFVSSQRWLRYCLVCASDEGKQRIVIQQHKPWLWALSNLPPLMQSLTSPVVLDWKPASLQYKQHPACSCLIGDA